MRICEPAENPHGLGQKTAVLNVDMPMRFQFSAWNVQKLPSCCYDHWKSGFQVRLGNRSTINSINQSIYILCLWDSSGESTDNNWENSIH